MRKVLEDWLVLGIWQLQTSPSRTFLDFTMSLERHHSMPQLKSSHLFHFAGRAFMRKRGPGLRRQKNSKREVGKMWAVS